jgi:Icc-related predicted phosphoesterase
MKIYHTSDIHLGRRRLNGRLPDQDLADAFGFIADRAIEDGADVFILAGDLFDRPQVEPSHLRQAEGILRRLKDAGIPVVAIEGNHDKAFIHSDDPTWVHYLADDNLLILLRPAFDPDGAVLKEWNQSTCKGAWIDIGGVRFTGAGYLGAATPNKVRQILDGLDDERPNVLLLHAGPDYFVGEGGGFSKEDLTLLEEKVCYLALGHIHKPMTYGSWACNPGSPENCDLREVGYDRDRQGEQVGRGYAVLEIDPSSPAAPQSLEVRSNPRRPCLQLELDCTPFGNKTKNGAAALIAAAAKLIKESEPAAEAVVELRLTGRLNLNRIALDADLAAAEIGDETGVYAVSIDPTGLNIEQSGVGLSGDEEGVSREDLERAAIRDLVDEEHLWGLDEKRQDFADFFFDLKEAVRTKAGPEALAEQIIHTPLASAILDARAEAARAAEAAAPAPQSTSHDESPEISSTQ